jgi:peptide/nickel transport system substrate-binding protein
MAARKTAALAVGAAMLLAAGSAMAQSTLRIGLAEDPDALDPTLARTFVGRIVFASLCDKLFDIGPDLSIVPQLATAYEWSGDNKALTIKLRPGVLFHDGTKMDAAAVKYSLERHLNLPGSNRKLEISAVRSVEAVDGDTVRINLAAPFAPLLAQLTDRAGMIVSPKAAEAAGDKFAAHPVCAGPYKFVERVAQDRIVVERFADYWNKDKVHIDRIVFLPITDAAVRRANLQSGSLDFIERVAPSDLPEITANPQLKTASIVELGYQGITINLNNGKGGETPLGQDARVREALDLAIDREALNQVVFEGKFAPGNQWVPPNSPWYIKEFPVPKRDVTKARQLLKEAGKRSVTVDFMVPNDTLAQQVAQVIQAMAGEAGFDMRIHATEFASSLNLAEKGEFGAYLLAWSGRTDPDGNLANFLSCKGPLNYSRYCNAEVDKEIAAAREVGDRAARLEHYRKVAAQVLKDRPLIYIYHRQWIYAFNDRLKGFAPYPDGLVRPEGLELK